MCKLCQASGVGQPCTCRASDLEEGGATCISGSDGDLVFVVCSKACHDGFAQLREEAAKALGFIPEDSPEGRCIVLASLNAHTEERQQVCGA